MHGPHMRTHLNTPARKDNDVHDSSKVKDIYLPNRDMNLGQLQLFSKAQTCKSASHSLLPNFSIAVEYTAAKAHVR